MKSIFVQIASYHDLELLPTVVDVLDKSSGEYRIDFGIHNCYYQYNIYGNSEIEKALLSIDKPYSVSIKHSCFPENIGTGRSRYIANQFYNGQDYYLQIDSHMRFVYNWDKLLVNKLHQAIDEGVNKPLMSVFPASYMIDGIDSFKGSFDMFLSEIDFHHAYYRADHGLDEKSEIVSGIFKDILQLDIPFVTIKEHFQKLYLSGAFVFSVGDYHRVEPNTKILHKGEESFHSFRLWTHGFDKVSLGFGCCFHYNRKKIFIDDRKFNSDYLWIVNRRRDAHNDLDKTVYDQMLTDNILEIKNTIEKNIVSPQGFGQERNFQELLQRLS